ncbi:DegT/DnrJ/EryC1/StrS family aminotransferase [Demequina sp.]|uniref:DegT/DnrJ/EryC1/StrS family aminotransferase n=1 Tax=Demequina sp. TaxID=2050685 RepID=UPI0025B7EE43|nr:DegT/DnrJ/EryC1/StrS family aminotransferase [Demequina sp.]
MTHQSGDVARHLADVTGTRAQDWFPVFKARYGMLEAFAALAATGTERAVVTQFLTCATAVDPILVAGMTPTYAEVSPATLSLDPDALELGSDTAAVVIQHTFGIVDQSAARRLAESARSVGALVCEDSAHCVGRMAIWPDGTPLADVSFHSFGAEKMLPTKFGGAVWVSPAMADRELRAAIVDRLLALKNPSPRLALAARTYRYQLAVLNRLPRGLSRRLRALLTATSVLAPPVAPAEREGRLAHAPVAASDWVAHGMASAMLTLPRVESGRARAVAAYVEELGDRVEVPAGITAGQPLVRFPFLAPPDVDADAVVARLREQGVVAGDWYRPGLYPGAVDPEVYGYRPGDNAQPVTEDVIARLVNLPTNVEPERARQIARQALAVIDSCRVGRA